MAESQYVCRFAHQLNASRKWFDTQILFDAKESVEIHMDLVKYQPQQLCSKLRQANQ